MHLLLTDRLTCPRCGPDFGLILLADRMVDRRVREGTFGCPNCRDAYPVRDGFGDLRAPPRGTLPSGLVGLPSGARDEAERVIALLGVAQGPGTLVLLGEPARHAEALAKAVDGIHVVAIDPDLADWPDAAGVSRMAAAPGIPLFSRSMRGVALDGRLGAGLLAEAARVIAPRGRVVVLRAEPDTEERLRSSGLEILASEVGTVVAGRR
jgi:uncharacterized protein YbaR (Trm112 family)